MYPVTYAVAPRSFNSVVPVQYMNRQDPQYVEKIYSKERKFNARHIIEEEDDLTKMGEVNRNYYLLNFCRGACARCCHSCSFCEWFYGCPMWFHIILIGMFLLLVAALLGVLGYALYGIITRQAYNNVYATRTYTRLYAISTDNGPGCNGNGNNCQYTTYLIQEGFVSGATTRFLSSKFLALVYLTIHAIVRQFRLI